MKLEINSYVHPVKIDGITIPNNLWLAPLAGYSSKALRLIAGQFGAGYAETEMISVEGLFRKNKRTWQYLDIKDEPFTTVQLFGKNEPKKFYEVSRLLQERLNVKIIDINFGCPVRKVVRSEAGSFLLKTPQLMSDIVKSLKDSGVIVSAKIRSGFDRINLDETIPVLEKAGADIIILHPRLAIQFYNGKADWDQIRNARQMTDKILIASGDITTPELAKEALDRTKADGIMIGRQAVGSPYIFKQIIDYFNNGKYDSYTLKDIKDIMLKFAGIFNQIQKKDNITAIRAALIQYVKNYKNSKEIRHRISQISSYKELNEVLKDW